MSTDETTASSARSGTAPSEASATSGGSVHAAEDEGYQKSLSP